ncbi:hypothetical protein [Halobacteriovorax marinus]|uniref:hypothetical protein n=1 Tax=Halobacteriovorax marinus TaxID=97084 RepID=UPI003A929B0A
MKKILIPLTFFLIGVGASYFAFNHQIVERKTSFQKDIDQIFDQNLSIEEINAKVFQLLFAYFAIDLRDIEQKINIKLSNDRENSRPEVIEKVVEKVVYLEQSKKEEVTEKPKIKKELTNKRVPLEKFNLSDFLKEALPILTKDKSFEKFNGNYKFIGNKNSGLRILVEIDNQFKLEKNSYVGVSKVDYYEIDKISDSMKVDGMPLNFLKNPKFPNYIVTRISLNRFIVLLVKEDFYNYGVQGAHFIKRGDSYEKDGLLRLESRE